MTKAELEKENKKLRSYLEKILEATTKEGIEKEMNELNIKDWDLGKAAAIGKIRAYSKIALGKD